MAMLKKILLALFSAPMYLYGYIVTILFMLLMFHMPKRFDRSDFTVVSEWRPWAAKIWKWNTCICASISMHNGAAARSFNHEKVHVRQFQDVTTLGLFLGAILAVCFLDYRLWLVVWALGPLFMIPNYLTAVLRGKHVYRGSEHEVAAYAATNPMRVDAAQKGMSWLEVFDEEDRGW